MGIGPDINIHIGVYGINMKVRFGINIDISISADIN